MSFPTHLMLNLLRHLRQELEESEAWIRERSSILGAQGYGKDLSSVLKLLQKHKTLAGELLAHRSLLQVRMCVFVYYVCVTSENQHLENLQVSMTGHVFFSNN